MNAVRGDCYPPRLITVAKKLLGTLRSDDGNANENVKKDSDRFNKQAPVAQTLDSAIHRINHYPADSVIGFPNTYPLDSDLSGR